MNLRACGYVTLDVFTKTPFRGNPLAVVSDSQGLSDSQMQAIAGEFNLSIMTRRAAVLWTGGKDCTLALCRARDASAEVACLATFYPVEDAAPFKAHPLDELRKIARDANLQHVLIPVSEPYREGYISGLLHLRDNYGIDAVVTGDIDLVDGYPNWIRECTQGLAIETITPLWQLPRESLLREIVERGILARVSWINSPHIPQTWLGRIIDGCFVEEIVNLAKQIPIDICGENGEYHTMVERIPIHGPKSFV